MKKLKSGRLMRGVLILAVLIICFVISPLFPYARSLAVMKIYSASCEKGSLPDTNGFEVSIPSGDGWYPFVMNFSDDSGFARYTGDESARLTIFYNFPEFSLSKGCSKLYDEDSSFYNAFYGAYFISVAGDLPYGFKNGEDAYAGTAGDDKESTAQSAYDTGAAHVEHALILDSDAIATVARFDFFELVLSDFGLKDEEKVFSYAETSRTENVSFTGSDGWTRMECEMTVNGASHEKSSFVRSYLQYGEPNFPTDEPFAPVKMYGLIIAKYLPEADVSAFFYVMAPSLETVGECEKNILSASVITYEN